MSEPMLRPMRQDDVLAVVAVQEPAAVEGLSQVFPQDRHPFPREAIADRWRSEIADELVECLVVDDDGAVVGFAALRGDEVLHFGIALEAWGSGLATAAHDELLERMRRHGVTRAHLHVYADNPRGRRFWEKHGWRATGERTRGPVAPHAELLAYELAISPSTSDVGRTSP